MSGARSLVWEALLGDPDLEALGVTQDSLFVNWSGDSPAAYLRRWVNLRWGAAEAPVGRDSQTRAVPLGIWAYDREPDYGAIQQILWRVRTLMLQFASDPCPGGGYLVQADWSFSSEDLKDEAYDAVMRGETYRVVTNAI